MSKPSEKQIHKQSLTEVVNYLNKENKTDVEHDSNEVEIYSKKNIRQLNKKRKTENKKIKSDIKKELTSGNNKESPIEKKDLTIRKSELKAGMKDSIIRKSDLKVGKKDSTMTKSEVKVEKKDLTITKSEVKAEKTEIKMDHKITNGEKLTRKDRRKLKIENRGKGISSKEFMKVFKEGPGKKIEKDEKSRSRMHMASRTKSEYPKSEETPKRRFKPSKKPRRN